MSHSDRNEWIRNTATTSRSNAHAPVSDAITIWHSSNFASREFVLLDARHRLVSPFVEWKSQWRQFLNVLDLEKKQSSEITFLYTSACRCFAFYVIIHGFSLSHSRSLNLSEDWFMHAYFLSCPPSQSDIPKVKFKLYQNAVNTNFMNYNFI